MPRETMLLAIGLSAFTADSISIGYHISFLSKLDAEVDLYVII